MLGGGTYYNQLVAFPPVTGQNRDALYDVESQLRQQGQELEQQSLQQPQPQPSTNRTNSDGALARLADSLDEESIDFISNLFQDKRNDQWRRGSIWTGVYFGEAIRQLKTKAKLFIIIGSSVHYATL